MTTKLQPTMAEIPEIQPEQRTFKMRCTGKGEALWARFELLYPVIITSRKFLGHLANGAAQDCELITVQVGGKMHKAMPSHVGPGTVDLILQAKGSTGIEVVLSCRVEPQTAGEPATFSSVEEAAARLKATIEGGPPLDEVKAAFERRPEDPAPRPPPVDPRSEARRVALELSASQPDIAAADGPFADLPPEVTREATANLQELLSAKNMDDATKKSIEAFIEADGDPTETLRGAREPQPA